MVAWLRFSFVLGCSRFRSGGADRSPLRPPVARRPYRIRYADLPGMSTLVPVQPADARLGARRILHGRSARAALLHGIDRMAALLRPTLGPLPRTVAIGRIA